ncbi:conserved Plasmodium protein, unknown function [Plasmodium gaboni]|uniref:Oocyst capsule protein n=1 Tax=Plasmodium gaboni TaxID=647221 RepID=A0ABY0KW50_9APIC|nr:conserved Plasmodium protein, unknown function [Plasmodium gaboni]
MIRSFLVYLFACFIAATRKKSAPKNDIISFNNLNEEKNLRYYSSGGLSECYMWYYLKEDFFEIFYLGNDDIIRKRKEFKKNKIVKKDIVNTRGSSTYSIGNNCILSDNVCTREILILLNTKKATCKFLSSFIVRGNENGEGEKKYITVEYDVSNHIFMINDYITTYIEKNEKRNVYIISKNKKKMVLSKSNLFKVYFDEKYIQHASITYGNGEYELSIRTKEKAGITKILIQLHNKCKPIFYYIIVFIYELLSLFPNRLDIAEESHVKLILKREKGTHLYNERSGNNSVCFIGKKKHIFKRFVDNKKIEQQYLVSYSLNNVIKRNMNHLKTMNCLKDMYITSFQNKYQIQPSKNYDIISDEIIKVRKNIEEVNVHIVVINRESHQKFTSIIFVHKIRNTDVTCFYPVYTDIVEKGTNTTTDRTAASCNSTVSSCTSSIPFSKKRKRSGIQGSSKLIEREIDQLRNHFYYKTNYYFDDFYLHNYYKINKKINKGEHFILGKRYLCIVHFYDESGRKLLNRNTNDQVKWTLFSKKDNLIIHSLYNFEEYFANYFVPIEKGIHSFQISYKNYPKFYYSVAVSSPIECYIKEIFIMSTLFILPHEKIYYKCYGGSAGKYTVQIFKKHNFLSVIVDNRTVVVTRETNEYVERTQRSSCIINDKENHWIEEYNSDRKNHLHLITLLFCDEKNSNNCFISRLYIVEKINDYSVILEKDTIEINEVTNIYFFMHVCSYTSNSCHRYDDLACLKGKNRESIRSSKKRINGQIKFYSNGVHNTKIGKEEGINYGYSVRYTHFSDKSSILLSSCFNTIHNDIKLKYDKTNIEVINKYSKFLKMPEKFKNACGFIQIKGKREKNANLIEMIYYKGEKIIRKSVFVNVYNKIGALLCQDFVCSKYIKFNQMINLILFNGFDNLPYRINISSESNIDELVIKENTYLNEHNRNICPLLFKKLFIERKFTNWYYVNEQKKGMYKNIYSSNNDTIFFANSASHYYFKKLYNRKLFEYDFVYNYFLLGKKETTTKVKRKGSKVINYYHTPLHKLMRANDKKYNISASSYEPFFPIKKYYIIYCADGKKNHITSNIIIEMIYNQTKPEIGTKNYCPVHIKYPSSIQITMFDKEVNKLHLINDTKILLYKNTDYYVKTFLIDEHDNVILTNENFEYTIETYIKNFQLQVCLKDKSYYLEMEEKKRKNVIKTNNKILVNCKDDTLNTTLKSKNSTNSISALPNCTSNVLLLTVAYSYKSDNFSTHFEKYISLHFFDKLYTNYRNLVLFHSPFIYYKLLLICRPSSTPSYPQSLIYSFEGNKQITILTSLEGRSLHVNKRKKYTIVDVDIRSRSGECSTDRISPKVCFPLYINAQYETEGVLTVRNKLIYETEHIYIGLLVGKMMKVRISLLSTRSEKNKPIPLRIECFSKDNKKFDYIPVQFLKIRLVYDYNKKIRMNRIDLNVKENNTIIKDIRENFQLNDEPILDLFYYINCLFTGKYYIQVEVVYKLNNKYISILSNMVELIIYSKGVLYSERKIVLHPFNQTVEVLFQYDHPYISKVLCISKNSSIVQVQNVIKTDYQQNMYVCSIKTSRNIGKTEVHIYPIFKSYYDMFPLSIGGKTFTLEKYDLDFYEIEKYYENYRKHKKCSNNICVKLEKERDIRKLYFFQVDIIVDYIHSMKLFNSDIIYLIINKELNMFVTFYSKIEKRPYEFINFNDVYKYSCISYKLDYFVNSKNVILNDRVEHSSLSLGRSERTFHRLNRGKKQNNKIIYNINDNSNNNSNSNSNGNAYSNSDGEKRITTDLVFASDSFLSIKAHKEGSYFLYANLTNDNNNMILSEIYNIVVVKNNLKSKNNGHIVYLSTKGFYKFHYNFHFLKLFNKYYYYPVLSSVKNIHTEHNSNSYYIYYIDKKKKNFKKILINVSDIIGAKINNYYSKYIPLNVIQYFYIDLYNKYVESVLFPLNAKLYLITSHYTILSAKIVNNNHIFIIPHKIGCSFVHIYLKLYKNYKEHNYLFDQNYEYIEIGKIHLCVVKRVKRKYFDKKNMFYYVNRLNNLFNEYNEEFCLQPYVCVNSVLKPNANFGTLLNNSNFHYTYKYLEEQNYIRNVDDLFVSRTKHFSIINDYCTRLKL